MAKNPFNPPGASVNRSFVEHAVHGTLRFATAPFRWAGQAFSATSEAIGNSYQGVRSVFKPDLVHHREALKAAAQNYAASAGDLTSEAAKNAARGFNNEASRLAFTEGKLGASLKGLRNGIAGVFGADTSQWGATAVKGVSSATATQDIARITEKTLATKANVFERVISKPFRVAANNPKTAIGLGLAASAVAVGSWLSGRAADRTEAQAAGEITAAQQKFMNSTTPADYAAMQQRMAAQGQTHAEVAMASKQAETAPSQAAM